MEKKLSKRRQKWCDAYQEATGFEPLMDDFLAGNETFQEAARASIQWFIDYCDEVVKAVRSIPA